MRRLSLIANTSIQYYRYTADVELDFGRSNKIYFRQPLDTARGKFTFENLIKVNNEGDETYYRKLELLDKGFLVNNTLKEGVDLTSCIEIRDEFYDVSNLKTALKKFEKKWIPMPFFKHNAINLNTYFPIDWVRCYLDCSDDYKSITIVLAIDTTLSNDPDDISSPSLSLNPDENLFKLNCSDEMVNNFLFNDHYQTQWIEEYIADIYFGKNEELRYEQPIKGYIANYLLLLNFINSLSNTPEIQLFTDDSRKIPVDLVIDIGNSATCALLFENSSEENFSFDKVKSLIINDFSDPTVSHSDPFPMNLVFSETKFGNIKSEKYHKTKFTTASFVRIGEEAKRLIDNSTIELNLGRELHTFNSSPKRYLWDTNQSAFEWDFYPTDLSKIKKVYLNCLSEQLTIDGSLAKDNVFGSKALYSRNSLMKFVFLEILNHSFAQINSFEFRSEHGDLTIPRYLKRITISCPTAMIQYEQKELRESAIEACILFDKFIKLSMGLKDTAGMKFEMPEVIPSISDINKNYTELEDRKDWNYDEATCSQLVFAYSLFLQKLNSNHYIINNILIKDNSNTLTIASIDIGAGTTDLMICKHDIISEKGVTIKPKPLFWESFKIAGDDMLKELIQQIIIEGVITNDHDEGCTGVIENYAKSIGIQNVSEKLNGFFGEDSNNIGYVAKMMRKLFIHQVAIPVSKFYLDKANQNYDSYHTLKEITGNEFRNQELVKYFTKHFGFSFVDIKWRVSSRKINEIVDSVFSKLISQISLIANEYGCDYIVLSGRPCSLNSIENLFVTNMAVNPDMVINLNNYWIGKWFPFSNNRGFVENPKTIVSTGAIIALMAGRLNKLADFKIDTEYLRTTIYTTSDYIVNKRFQDIEVVFSPTKEEAELTINKLPCHLGYCKIIAKSYPITQLYSLGFNDAELYSNFKRRFPNMDDITHIEYVNRYKAQLLHNMPLKLTLSREYDVNKERIKVESIEDREGGEINIKFLQLNLQTLESDKGYWLDTCEFVLNVRNI
jgi:hypothetical protein